MPNSKQANKRLRQDEKRRVANKSTRTLMKTAMKQVFGADSTEAAEKAMPMAMKRVDKASKRNIIHSNAAARLKSQLAKSAASKG